MHKSVLLFYVEGPCNIDNKFYNILPDSCQFNNPGIPCSKTWELFLWHVFTQKDRAPLASPCSGVGAETLISGNFANTNGLHNE